MGMPRRYVIGISAGIAGALVLALVISVALITDPFGSDTLSPTESELRDSMAAGVEPVEGGEYIEGDVGFPESLNPFIVNSASERTVSTLLYRGLTGTDRKGVPEPELAIAWTISEDGKRYDVTLDSEARWHDGESVRVEDVIFTVSLIQDAGFPGDPSLSRFWRGISVEAIGDSTVRFELMEPYAGFLNYLSLPILPKHVHGSMLAEDLVDPDYDWSAIGTGTFMLDSISERDGEIRFSSVERDGESVYLDQIVFRYFDTREEVFDAFLAGEVDGVSHVSMEALEDPDSLPEGTRIYAPSLSGYTAVYFNIRHPLLQDRQTRRAIEHAIDRASLVDTVLGGHAVPGTSPIPLMLAAHSPGDHARYDPGRAVEMLEEQGWYLEEGEEIRQRDGQWLVVPLLVNSEDAQRVAIATFVQRQLYEVGIAIEIHALSSTEVKQALNSRQFAAALYGWHTENGDPDCYQLWHSSQIDQGMNFTGFSHQHADELLVNARRSINLEERNEHYERFQQIFAEQVPAVVLFYPRYHFAVSARIDGAEPTPLLNPSDRVRQIPKWYVVEEPAEEAGTRIRALGASKD